MPWNPTWELDRRTPKTPALHDVMVAMSRQRKLAVTVFVVVFVAIILFGLVLSDHYQARMEILVNQAQLRRAEPVLTSAPDAKPIVEQAGTVNDESINSEIELLQSPNVLQEVVEKSGLDKKTGLWDGTLIHMWNTAHFLHMTGFLHVVADVLPFLRRPTQQELTAKAMQRLSDKLHIEVLKMSNVISVTYRSNHPQLAAQVLNTLGHAYLTEHALAHHPPGELKFFQNQTDQARAEMERAQQKLTAFTQSTRVASGSVQMNDALLRLSNATADLDATRAGIAATERRIRSLNAQATQIPQRQMTRLQTADSGILLQNLKSTLLSLQTRQTALLTQYQPSYPLVQEVDKQIAQTRAALAEAENSRLQTKTTDRDPDYEMVREDLTKAQADLAALTARASTLTREIANDTNTANSLQGESITQQNLMQNAKAAAANYGMLLQKEQQAQISDALDKEGVFNVTIAQQALVPALPMHSTLRYVLYGILLSILCAFGAAIGADRLDSRVRTLDEVELLLRAPVVAAFPSPLHAFPLPGDGTHKKQSGNKWLLLDL